MARADQGVRDERVTGEASGARATPTDPATGIAGLIQRVLAWKPVRVFMHYSSDNGPLLASGMSYQAFFALFAALFGAFSVAGFVIKGNAQLQAALTTQLNALIPNLIGPTGVIKNLDSALDSTALGVTGLISLVGVLLTAVGFLGTLRTAIRIMFALPGPTTNPVVLKLKDLGLAIALGALVLLSAAVSVVTTTAITLVFDVLGLTGNRPLTSFAGTAIGFVVTAGIFTVILVAAFRILSGIPVPRGRLWAGAVIGGVGLAILQTLSGVLLQGAGRNPLISSFGVVIGLFLYFNFICQVVLLASSWIAVGMQDAGIDARSLTPEQRQVEQAEQLEDARRLVADANRTALEQRIRDARGLARWRQSRELQRMVRDEARRRSAVPTTQAFSAAQSATEDPDPDADQVAQARSAPETAR
ncbi:YihY/virulence factor BrkB family protein [uncultured Amnibacterium sp.]|uniref:YihY/virulence factor BrkB family protein n=1 Tax=uncultured Amnibacterium sp. TaxID=1631851 RepID=UPI0035CB8CA2